MNMGNTSPQMCYNQPQYMPAPQTPVTPQYQPQYQQLISQSATPQWATSMMADMKSLKELGTVLLKDLRKT